MEFKTLFGNFTQPGIVTYISVRPERLKPVMAVQSVMAIEGKGLQGDRYKSKDGSRQVTIIQQEHLKAVASFLGRNEVNPSLTRRNIVVEGINLLALKDKVFNIGEAVFEYSGECHPCSRMEQNLEWVDITQCVAMAA